MTDGVLGGGRERLSFGAVVRVFFGLLQRNGAHLTLLTVLFAVLPALAFGVLRATGVIAPPDPDDIVAAMRGAPGELIVIGLFGLLLQGAVSRACLDDLAGTSPTYGRSFAAARSHFLPLFGVGFLTNVGVLLGLIVLIVPGVYLYLRWMVGSAAQVAEDRGVTESLTRSMQLTKGSLWVLLGLTLVFIAGVLVVSFLMGILLAVLPMGPASLIGEFVIFDPLIGALTSLGTALGATAVYAELRRIREGAYAGDLSVFD